MLIKQPKGLEDTLHTLHVVNQRKNGNIGNFFSRENTSIPHWVN